MSVRCTGFNSLVGVLHKHIKISGGFSAVRNAAEEVWQENQDQLILSLNELQSAITNSGALHDGPAARLRGGGLKRKKSKKMKKLKKKSRKIKSMKRSGCKRSQRGGMESAGITTALVDAATGVGGDSAIPTWKALICIFSIIYFTYKCTFMDQGGDREYEEAVSFLDKAKALKERLLPYYPGNEGT